MYENIQSPSSAGAEQEFLENPDILQSIYYQVGNSSNFLIGAFNVLEIPSGELDTNCVHNGLMNHLQISCLPEYTVGVHDTDKIRGDLNTYSVADTQKNELVYDLSTYVPSVDSRVVAIRFNVLNVNSGNIGIVEMIFEKSVHGPIFAFSKIVVIPPSFVYIGGTRSYIEIVTFIGQISVLTISLIFVIIWFLKFLIKRPKLNAFAPFLALSVMIMTVTSIFLELSVLFASPLVAADLGVSQYVNLIWVSDRFSHVNQLNGIIIVFLTQYLIFNLFLQSTKSIVPFALVWSLFLVLFAVLLNLLFPTRISFVDAAEYLIRICLGNITRSDFLFFQSLGFSSVVLLFAFVLLYCWVLGAAIGTLLKTAKPPSVRLPQMLPPESLVSDDSPADDTCPLERDKEQAIDPLVASIEMMAGKALGEIEAVKTFVDTRMNEVRDKIEKTATRMRETYLLLS